MCVSVVTTLSLSLSPALLVQFVWARLECTTLTKKVIMDFVVEFCSVLRFMLLFHKSTAFANSNGIFNETVGVVQIVFNLLAISNEL